MENENSAELRRQSPARFDKMRGLTYCLYAFGFLDLFAVAMIIPVASRQATTLGGSPTVIGLVGTVYGTLQLVSGPFIGRWSDVGGRRPVLLLCLFFTALGYMLMGMAGSVSLYILARIPLGIFKHSVSITKALLAEITPKEHRASVFGYFNGVSSTGFIIGPLVGGHLAETENGFYKVAMCSAVIFASCFVIVLLFVHPDGHHDGLLASKSIQDFTRDEYNLNLQSFFGSFHKIIKAGPDLFLIRFLMGFSVILFRSNFSLTLEQKFNTTPIINGRIISFGSLASVLAALFVGRLVKFYGNIPRLYLHSSMLRIAAMLMLTFAPNIPTFMIFYSFLAMSNSLGRVFSTNLSISRGSVDDTGALLGLNQSLMSISRTISPLVAGMAQEISYAGPGILSIILSTAGTVLISVSDLEGTKTKEKRKAL